MCAQMRGNYSYLKTAVAMGDKGETARLQFLLYLLLCLTQTGTSSSQCLDNLPQYGSRGTGGDVPRLASNNIYIIPNYTFSCYGNVAQWGACVERDGGGNEYTITFSVYRPSDVFPDCYSNIGTNTIVDGTATDGCITLNVPVSDQISVEPGDVVGLYHSGGGMHGIETDNTVSNVTAWYNTLDIFDIGPPNCPYRTGPGESFPNSATAAPVITAVVEPFPTSTLSPPHSTSSHSLIPSTPSPSTIPSPSLPTQDGGSTLSTSTVAGIAVGAVGVVIIILLIIISIILFKVKDTSNDELKVEMKSNECYTATTTTHSETHNAMKLKNNEAYQSATDTITMEQNKVYQSVTDTVTMEQNEAYSGTVVGATQDVTYEEVDGMYEEV